MTEPNRPAVPSRDSFPLPMARRIALAAQGLADPRPDKPVDRRAILKTISRLGLLQLDSVNVLVRSHYMPIFSRLGPYDPALLDDIAWGRKRALFEYWGHEASLLPLDTQPLLRWRMAEAARLEGGWGMARRIMRERPDFVAAVLQEVAKRGPIGAGDLAEAGERSGKWWGWNDGKIALEHLFWAGRLTTATRRNFERLYGLPEKVLPRALLERPTPSEEDACRELMLIAGRALGIATLSDLRDYFRLSPGQGAAALARLVEEGALVPVTVKGWRHQAYLDPAARIPRQARGRALLTPFDSLIWERPRAERLFGFRYRIEIYTPAEKRQDGYYVLPFLLGDRLVGRVDLKAARAEGVLRVQAAHIEPGADMDETAEALAEELGLMAGWLGLERVETAGRGALSPALEAALRTRVIAVSRPSAF